MAKMVKSGFDELLARQKLTYIQEETAKTREIGLRTFFDKNFVMATSPFSIGSYARGTLCATERDIDLLAPFSVSDYWERYHDDSRSFLYWVRDALNERYATTEVSSKRVAVTLDFTVIKADIVPCFQRKGGGYLMPNGSGRWMATNPTFHTALIGEADVQHGRRLKPLIRLVKTWNIVHGHRLSSFHVELMGERVMRGHDVEEWPIAMAKVLQLLPGWVRSRFDDPWSGASRVDAYLSSSDRDLVIRMLEEDAKRAAEAEQYRQAGKVEKAFERWGVVYRGEFPAYG